MNRPRLFPTLATAWVGVAVAIAFTVARPAFAELPPEVVAPQQLAAPALVYPAGARGDAAVILELEVAEDGTVTRATLKDGPQVFVDEALRAARSFRFAPATRNGIPVRARIRARLAFHEPPADDAGTAPIDPQGGAAGSQAQSAGSAGALRSGDGGVPGSVDSGTPTGAPAAPDGERSGALTAGSATHPSNAGHASAAAHRGPIEISVVGEEREELGSIHIPRGETRLVPGAFADPFRVVEVLPGVAPIMNGLPYFFVRGSPPGDVGYFIDGVRVPLLFHVGAGPSVIAPALVDRVDLYPSAYPARYGRAVGGVMAGETVGPSPTARGEAQARIFDTGGMVEQPFANGKGSVLLGGRYSYTQALLALIAPDYELGYGDYQARVAYAASPRDRLSVFAFGAYDRLRNAEEALTLFDVAFHRVDLRWDRVHERGRVRVAGTVGTDRVRNAEEESAGGSRLSTHSARMRFELEHKFARDLRVRGGGDVGVERVGEDSGLQGMQVVAFPARTDAYGGVYADAIWRPGPGVEIVPGLRVDGERLRGESFLYADPRLATRVKVAYGVSWVAAFGLAHQSPRDTVRIPAVAPSAVEALRREAWQMSQGLEVVLPASMLAKATLFHAWVDSAPAHVRSRNDGIELFLRRDFTERLGGFLAYTLSRAERMAGNTSERSSFDRTHVLSLVLGYDLGRGFRIGSRLYYATGRPFYVACPTADCGPGDPAVRRPYRGAGELPGFMRVDLRLEKRWSFASGAWIATTFEWFNALVKEEVTGMNWTSGGLRHSVNSAITLPSIGIEAGY